MALALKRKNAKKDIKLKTKSMSGHIGDIMTQKSFAEGKSELKD